jgi:hypothetical protein
VRDAGAKCGKYFGYRSGVGRRGVGLWARAPRLPYDAPMLSRLAPVVIGAAVLSGTVGACSLILDTGDLPTAPNDAPVDARPPDANLDANPMAISIMSVEPLTIHEGVGTGGGRPAQIYMKTNNLLPNATVSIAWADGSDVDPPELVESMITVKDGGAVGLSIRIPETEALDEVAGEDPAQRELTITVVQMDPDGASYMATTNLAVKGHDALVVTGNVVTDTLDPDRIYTSVKLGETAGSGTIRAVGSRPLIYNAIGAITVNSNIDVSGNGFASNGSATPGAGGCRGGLGNPDVLLGGPGDPGACGVSGGSAGAASGGAGGGGGYGTAGSGNAAGAGEVAGNAMLVPFTAAAAGGENHGNGGGGGGASSLLGPGTAGGHGGGAVGLTAGGALEIHGTISANGAAGNGGGGGGGKGGGGSGGAILLRSATAIPAATLSANGGTAANSAAGGAGRIRVDAPQLSATASPPVVAGPSWSETTPTLVTSPTFTARINGTGCQGVYGAEISNGGCIDPRDAALPNDITITLAPGFNRVCTLWTGTEDAGGTEARAEAKSCVDIVYLQPPVGG